MNQQIKPINGVFEGGGVRGIGLVGALAIMEEKGYKLVNVAGTSAGAIVATLYAAGYTAVELFDTMMGLDFEKFTDQSRIGRIPILGPCINVLFRNGLYKGDYFLDLMSQLLAAKKIRYFGDLTNKDAPHDDFRFKVRVVAADITAGRMLVLPGDIQKYGESPEDFEVVEAVRMSMSIPLFFMPRYLREPHSIVRNMIVDGGLLSNFPLELMDKAPHPTVGFRLVEARTNPPETFVRHPVRRLNPIIGPVSELVAMFNTAMNAHDAHYIETHKFLNTIAIDTLDVAATDFHRMSTDKKKKEELYESGRKAAQAFLETWNPSQIDTLYPDDRPGPSRRVLTSQARAVPGAAPHPGPVAPAGDGLPSGR